MHNIIKQSFSLNMSVLRFFGLYPSKKDSKLRKVRGYMFHFFLLLLVIPLLIVKIFLQENVKGIQMNFNVSFLAGASCLCVKFLIILKNSDRIEKCVDYFGHEKFAPRDTEERRIITECIRICRRNSLVLFDSEIMAIGVCIIPMLFTHQLPIDIWLPINPNLNSWTYYPTLMYLLGTFIYCGFNETLINPLIAGLAYHATSQLKILKYNLRNLDKCVDSSDLNVYTFLKNCIDRHNSILDFVKKYEECFSFPIFCQFAGSMFCLCFCCIGMILAPSAATVEFIKPAACFFIASFQISFYCFYGTLLFEENNKFSEAVYMGPWYKYDTDIRMILFIIMERSKRPMVVTAGKIVDVTLQTFASVLKTSYSLIAVLNNY